MELSVNRLLAENTGGSSTSKVILQSGLSCISAFVEANMHHTYPLDQAELPRFNLHGTLSVLGGRLLTQET